MLWAYCHVPDGSTVDMTDRIEAQIERFAPGFRDMVLARTVTPPAELERLQRQHHRRRHRRRLTRPASRCFFRPRIALDPYRMADDLYICSQSTPPGPGVHGMCGYYAAKSALKHLR